MTNVLQLGIVGCGDIADFTAWFARLNRHIQIAACCDVDRQRAERFAKRFKIPEIYIDYQEMVASVALDAVYLAVPHHLHYNMMLTAVEAGLPVFVEKPITCTLEEGTKIVQLAEEQDILIGVNYQYRYDSGCYALARAVQSGALGEIYYARCNIPWHRDSGYFENAGWHSKMSTSCGGTLLTQGSHILDIALWALGDIPTSALGITDRMKFREVEVEDLALGIVELSSGVKLQVSSSMVAFPEQSISIDIYGQKGTAIYTDKPLPRVRFRGVKVKKEKPPVWGVHALQRSIEGFRRWVVEAVPYLTPGKEALPVLAAVEAIYRSSDSGRRKIIDASIFEN